MSILFFLFAGLSLLVAMLAAPTLLRPAFMGLKLAALGLAVSLIGLFHLSGTELLGRPKPAGMEILADDAEDITVIASHMVEGEAIYLWLDGRDDAEPRAYSLPWTRQSAEDLQEATRVAESTGTDVRVRGPFKLTADDSQPTFYATPQQAPPPKDTGRSLPSGTRLGDAGSSVGSDADEAQDQPSATATPDLGTRGRRINLWLAPIIVIERQAL